MLDFLRSCRVYLERTAVYGLISLFTSQQVPPKAYLNTIGIQAMRIDWARKLMNYRRRKKKEKYAREINQFAAELTILECDGIVLVQDFLPDNCLEEIARYQSLPIEKCHEQFKYFKLRGAEYLDGVVEDVLPATSRFLRQSSLIQTLPKIYLGRNSVSQNWRLKYVRDLPGQMDVNCLNHSDTFHNTLKMWIYLDNVEMGEDSLKFWKRSHLPHDGIDNLRVQGLVEGRGSPRIDNAVMETLGFQKFDQSIKANSLIIADIYGCHFRNYAPQKTEWRPTFFL